jgi:hypothetical protein
MRISRSTGALTGLMLVVLGLWGGLIPFVGPYFHYAFGSDSTWHYTTERLLLDILPGVAVIVGGLVLCWSGNRLIGIAGGWLAIAGGTWFVIGPAVSRVWEHAATPIGGPLYGRTRQMLELVGYFYGLGALIIALATFALGRYVSRPSLAPEPAPAAEPVPEPVAVAEPVHEPEPVAEPVPEAELAAEPVHEAEPAAKPTVDRPDTAVTASA